MYIKIYQINSSRDTENVKFFSLKNTEKHQGSSNINSSIYDEVFSGDVDCSNLEDIYTMFNLEHHPLHRGHSLSMSDIVVVDGTAHFCDEVGFCTVDFDESQTHKPDTLMRILYVEPNRKPFISELDNTLEAMQRAVKGLIEPIYLSDEVCAVGNEEAKLIGMEGNRRLGNDIIAGPFFICGTTEDCDFRSLTDSEVEEYSQRFAEPEQISQSEVVGNIRYTITSFNL